ncbi:hypothetical protein C2S52_005557 [Perilla frutescens var. hirtella]|nr:hypothetical protein C2S52_005557 [Perilla frutescens var. hirtella]
MGAQLGKKICEKRPSSTYYHTNGTWAKKDEGKAVKKIIMNDKAFWPSVVYSIKITNPLVNVLKMVDSEITPTMRFIYGAMDEVKEKIAKNLDGEVFSYKEIWDIIDERWEKQLHRNLHIVGYYLNPRLHGVHFWQVSACLFGPHRVLTRSSRLCCMG